MTNTTTTTTDTSTIANNNYSMSSKPQQRVSTRASNEGLQVTINANASSLDNSNSTPPGWNSGRRYVARLVLWFVVLTLMSGLQIWATFFSALSIIILKEGTLFSGKNIKWMILSGVSFLASLGSWSLERSYEAVDEEKAYGLKICLWLGSKSMQGIWGIVLAVFLFSAALSKSATTTGTTAIASSQPQR